MEPNGDERKEALLAECEVSPQWLQGLWERLDAFVEPFAQLLSNRKQRGHLSDDVAGLCAPVERKTSETIAYFHQQDRQALQRFVGWVEWDHRPLLRELAGQVSQTIGESDGILIIDGSAFSKKGTESAGVQRQWSGRAGKIDNCQIGASLGDASGPEQALADVRLFGSWPSNGCGGKKSTPALTLPQVRTAIAAQLWHATGPHDSVRLAREIQRRLIRNASAKFYHWKKRNQLPPLYVRQRK